MKIVEFAIKLAVVSACLFDEAAIAKTVEARHDTYKADFIAPGHCTGEPTFAALKRAFGDRYLYAGLDTVIGLGATPAVLAKWGDVPTMDGNDRLLSCPRP